MAGPVAGRATLLAALLLTVGAGCALLGSDQVDPALDDRVAEARTFTEYPIYWLGEEFEGHELAHLELPFEGSATALVYGTCRPSGSDHPSCRPPLLLQIQPICAGIGAVAADRSWERRSIRGAPLGAIDGAPVLLTSRVQVKVYAGDNVTSGVSYRALQALRSLNDVDLVIGPDDPIPGADREFLAGHAPCPT